MTSDAAICAISILTILALKVSLSHSEPSDLDVQMDNPEDFNSKLDRMRSLYSILEDQDIPEKRRSLFRFGKRRSLFRFGKRGSLLRFGKRPEWMDSGDYSPLVPAELYPLHEDPRDTFFMPDKRSSIFRFGKKSRDTDNLFETRTTKEKKPHTPWRFGREEDYLPGDGYSLVKE